MTDNLTPRARAVGILSGSKVRILKDAELTVVDKARLEALEKVAKRASVFVRRWSRDRTQRMYSQEQIGVYKKQCAEWERELLAAVNELEAMHVGQTDERGTED